MKRCYNLITKKSLHARILVFPLSPFPRAAKIEFAYGEIVKWELVAILKKERRLCLQRAEAEIIFPLSLENMTEEHKLWTLQKL